MLTASFLDQGMGRVRNLLKKHEDELHTLANALIEYETLDLQEVKRVLKGEKLDRISASGSKLQSQQEKEEAEDRASGDADTKGPIGVPTPVPVPVAQEAPREV